MRLLSSVIFLAVFSDASKNGKRKSDLAIPSHDLLNMAAELVVPKKRRARKTELSKNHIPDHDLLRFLSAPKTVNSIETPNANAFESHSTEASSEQQRDTTEASLEQGVIDTGVDTNEVTSSDQELIHEGVDTTGVTSFDEGVDTTGVTSFDEGVDTKGVTSFDQELIHEGVDTKGVTSFDEGVDTKGGEEFFLYYTQGSKLVGKISVNGLVNLASVDFNHDSSEIFTDKIPFDTTGFEFEVKVALVPNMIANGFMGAGYDFFEHTEMARSATSSSVAGVIAFGPKSIIAQRYRRIQLRSVKEGLVLSKAEPHEPEPSKISLATKRVGSSRFGLAPVSVEFAGVTEYFSPGMTQIIFDPTIDSMLIPKAWFGGSVNLESKLCDPQDHGSLFFDVYMRIEFDHRKSVVIPNQRLDKPVAECRKRFIFWDEAYLVIGRQLIASLDGVIIDIPTGNIELLLPRRPQSSPRIWEPLSKPVPELLFKAPIATSGGIHFNTSPETNLEAFSVSCFTSRSGHPGWDFISTDPRSVMSRKLRFWNVQNWEIDLDAVPFTDGALVRQPNGFLLPFKEAGPLRVILTRETYGYRVMLEPL